MDENTNLPESPKPSRRKKSIFSSLTTEFKEVQFKAEAKAVTHRKFYVSNEERRRLIKEVNDAGLLLFEYYLTLAGVGSQDVISDERTAKHFGWTVTKAQKIRQNLGKHGWFDQKKYNYTDQRKGITYYLGKAKVAELHSDPSGLTDSLYGSNPQWP